MGRISYGWETNKSQWQTEESEGASLSDVFILQLSASLKMLKTHHKKLNPPFFRYQAKMKLYIFITLLHAVLCNQNIAANLTAQPNCGFEYWWQVFFKDFVATYLNLFSSSAKDLLVKQ